MDGYRPYVTPNKEYIVNDLLCIDILLKLREEAKKLKLNNVHIILLLGNHEISNITDHGLVNARYQQRNNYQNLVHGRVTSFSDVREYKDIIGRDIEYDYVYGTKDNLNSKLCRRIEKINDLFKYFICSYLSVIKINDTLFSHALINNKSLRILFRLMKRLIVSLYKQGKIELDENIFNFVDEYYDEDNIIDMTKEYPVAGLHLINTFLRYILISLYYSMYKFNIYDENIDRYKKYLFNSKFYNNEDVFNNFETYDKMNKKKENYIPESKYKINGDLFYDYMNSLISSFYFHDPYQPRHDDTGYNSHILSELFSNINEIADINQYPTKVPDGEIIWNDEELYEESDDELAIYEFKRLDNGSCYEYDFNLDVLTPKQSYYNNINNDTFDIFKINNMYIGHIPNDDPVVHKLKVTSEGINPRSIYYNDIFLSRAFSEERPEVLSKMEKTLFIFSYTDEEYVLNTPYYNTYVYHVSIVKNM